MATVTIIHGALDESPLRGGSIILRGVIDPDSLMWLQVDQYQREVLLGSTQNRLIYAFTSGEVMPDIELGMRGQSFYQPKVMGKIQEGTFVLKDPVFIIDGLQRRSAALNASGHGRRLGATIHFDTTKEWEEERFFILNSHRIRVSPNIHLRNLRDKHPGVQVVYQLTMTDRSFCACERVSWNQRMKRDDLFGAHTVMQIIGHVHSWAVTGMRGQNVMHLATAFDNLVNKIGSTMLKNNIRSFYNMVDECWGVNAIQYRESAPQIKTPFLGVLAAIMCDHKDFWTGRLGSELFVNKDTKRKLRLFPMADPTVMNLAGSHGKARHQLYMMLRDHINSGRRTNRLQPREPLGVPSLDEEDNGNSEAA
jgi:hypothetical protein